MKFMKLFLIMLAAVIMLQPAGALAAEISS